MKINIGKLLGAIINVAKANPSLVISAVTAIGPVVKAIKAETKQGGEGKSSVSESYSTLSTLGATVTNLSNRVSAHHDAISKNADALMAVDGSLAALTGQRTLARDA